MVKFIDEDIFKHWSNATKAELEKARDILSDEIDKGILSGIKYQKELELINYRLEDKQNG